MTENKEDQQDFTRQIEKIVYEMRVTHLEAITIHCQRTGLEIEVAAKLVGRALKKKLKEEGMILNLIRSPKTGKLPI